MNKPFYIQLERGSVFKKGTVLNDRTTSIIVIKYIRNSRWNWFLRWLGFNIRIGLHKVKLIKNE